MVRKEGGWSVDVRWEDLQVTSSVIAYSTRVGTALREQGDRRCVAWWGSWSEPLAIGERGLDTQT
jgi:hypothetical protein